MADGMTVQISGNKRLIRQFNSLKGGSQRRMMRPGVTKAAKPVVKMARSLVPAGEGLLKKSLGTQVTSYKRRGSVIVRMGARSGFGEIDEDGKNRDPKNYAHLVENGTVFTAPKPFLRPAMDAHRSKIPATVAREIRTRIAKELAKTK